ncbi:hypothetical protein LTR56_009721 [Elasticomyces elasticus]|nr:hypothetical protein LTR22_025079 [Elasticomyces elasticus]KAK3644184.1 hypothetical protein LTR56_009721 [Elasticomyces elasticus]KAK4919141.1 hypothetical protein LTR49_013145 [Elasticomyces elasticus]KAK5741802.1 hypothetical protein LTS12_024479 [Elasticomyces elasticus]
MVNFTACQADFLNNATNLALYSYHGPTEDIVAGDHHFITLKGCNKLCGTGSELYSWSIIGDTMITWVLPMLVMFLLAPFEPNQGRNTCFSSIRWIGSPFVSMWYVLCNIKVTGRCAEIVDMAVPYHSIPDEGSDFGDFRDAMAILGCMNQYLLDTELMREETSSCAERVLRVALFGDLKLESRGVTLRERRRKIAMTIRIRRRKGVVQILIGLLWFLFILGLSISFTFNDIGEDSAGHNLAMGLAVSWITPLVMGAVVDRNPTATKDLRVKFNRFWQEVRDALRDLQAEPKLLDGASDETEISQMPELGDCDLGALPDEIFVDFAGQGRLRWHRGIAHPILTGIEKSHAAAHGRGWFNDQALARKALLVPFGPHGFRVSDRRLVFQAVGAFLIVYGNLAAGFLISFYTPTVGIGCRVMGYMVFAILTFSAALGELCMEFVTAPTSMLRRLGHWSLFGLECVNVCWLVAITILQTFGFYQTCFCLSASMGFGGGYIEFDDLGHDHTDDVLAIWSFGTVVAGTILLSSLVYIVTQWMEQSHLMTSDYDDARRGLVWTRRCRRARGWVTLFPRKVAQGSYRLFQLLVNKKRAPPRRVRWST